MAGFYQPFVSARATEPEPVTLIANLRALDATAGVQHEVGPAYVLKKGSAWTAPQIAAAQTVIDTAPAATAQLVAQTTIDQMPIATKAIVLALIDQLNVVRSKLIPALPDITPAQAIAAVRAKAGTL